MQKRNILNFLNVLTIVVNHNSHTATLVTDPVLNIHLMLYILYIMIYVYYSNSVCLSGSPVIVSLLLQSNLISQLN